MLSGSRSLTSTNSRERMHCTNFAGTWGKQLARQNGGRDSKAGGSVPVGKRGNVSEDDIEVDRETLDALDTCDGVGRPVMPVGHLLERIQRDTTRVVVCPPPSTGGWGCLLECSITRERTDNCE